MPPLPLLGALIDTDRVGDLLRRLGLAEHMNAGMFDNLGTVLYRTPDTLNSVGRRLPEWSPLFPRLGRPDFALVEGRSISGEPSLFADAPSGEFSLTRLFDRANEQERLFGLRLDGLWMHVGTPDAVGAAEEAFLESVA